MNATSPFAWIPDLCKLVMRRGKVVAITAGTVVLAAIAYLLLATPKFTATTTLLIDTQAAAPFQQQAVQPDAQFANGIVESQVEVLQSGGLARMVVRRMGLADQRAFLIDGRSILGTVMGAITSPFVRHVVPTVQDRETMASELLLQMIAVKRVGLSYIIDLSVRSRSAAMSADIVNGIAAAYVDAGLGTRSDNTRRASVWLQQRITQLHEQAIAADDAVQQFKARAHIVDTDKGLMNERQLGELNSQLVLARARTADTHAKLERIRAVLRQSNVTGTVSEATQSDVSVHLREAYVDAARQAAELQTRLGAGHAAVVALHHRMADIASQMRGELQRIADGYQSDDTIAAASERDLRQQLQDLSTDAGAVNAALVTLRGLQSSADTYRTLYENFLQRYTQAVQDQSFPISEAQIVTTAMPPLRKSSPKATLVLAAAVSLGIALGFAIAFVLDTLDHAFRNADQVRSVLGVPCLASLPLVAPGRVASVDPVAAVTTEPDGARMIPAALGLLRHAVVEPRSAFADTMHVLRMRMLHGRSGRRNVVVLGCVSTQHGEGRTTVAANLAFQLACNGSRTLLLDWDRHNSRLSRALAPAAIAGFVDVAEGRIAIADALWRDSATGLHLLPCTDSAGDADMLHAPTTLMLLRTLRDQYDSIVIDLPTTLGGREMFAAAQAVDGLLMVVQWGQTRQDTALEHLRAAGIDNRVILGVVLNKVDARAARLYTPSFVPMMQPVPELAA